MGQHVKTQLKTKKLSKIDKFNANLEKLGIMETFIIYDKLTKKRIGTILLRKRTNFSDYAAIWEIYQKHYNSNKKNKKISYYISK